MQIWKTGNKRHDYGEWIDLSQIDRKHAGHIAQTQNTLKFTDMRQAYGNLNSDTYPHSSSTEWICLSRFVSVHVVHPYSSIDVTAAWKKLRFILSVRSDFHIIDSLVSTSFSVDSTLLPRYVNLSTSLSGVPSRVEMSPVWL